MEWNVNFEKVHWSASAPGFFPSLPFLSSLFTSLLVVGVSLWVCGRAKISEPTPPLPPPPPPLQGQQKAEPRQRASEILPDSHGICHPLITVPPPHPHARTHTHTRTLCPPQHPLLLPIPFSRCLLVLHCVVCASVTGPSTSLSSICGGINTFIPLQPQRRSTQGARSATWPGPLQLSGLQQTAWKFRFLVRKWHWCSQSSCWHWRDPSLRRSHTVILLLYYILLYYLLYLNSEQAFTFIRLNVSED